MTSTQDETGADDGGRHPAIGDGGARTPTGDLHDIVAELLRIGLGHGVILSGRPPGQASSDVTSTRGSPAANNRCVPGPCPVPTTSEADQVKSLPADRRTALIFKLIGIAGRVEAT